MKKRPSADRTFMMLAGLAKKDSSSPTLHLSRYQRMAHARHSALLEENESIEKPRQVEERSAQWGRLFHSWFDDNPLPMMAFDRENLAILAVNQAAVSHYGYSREEFLSMTIEQIRPPEEIPHLLEALRAGDRGISGPSTGRHRKKDGTLFDVEVYSQSETLGSTIVFAQIFDLTERKWAEAELRESERRYRYIFQSTGVSIWEEDFSQIKIAVDDLKARGVQDFRQYLAAHPEFVEQAMLRDPESSNRNKIGPSTTTVSQPQRRQYARSSIRTKSKRTGCPARP